jgi:oxygen-independent coproporphyrinogen III oxidase
MAGIYIHIPYCKHKCEYCDFYSVVSSNGIKNFQSLIIRELDLRKNYLPNNNISTIYLGGGTPSLLKVEQIEEILLAISLRYNVAVDSEITLEANPDDLSIDYLSQLRKVGVNRLSIGIQSFADADLIKLDRRHNSKQAIDSVEWANKAGFDNISIDLIYGLPYSNSEGWKDNLETAFRLPIKHLSCYHLIYEENTPLHKKMQIGSITPVHEELSVEQFKILQTMAEANGFDHYEISNLGKLGYYSKHNTSYWQQEPYLGLGPSAHSYNVITRNWNPRSIPMWSSSIKNGSLALETEQLTTKDRINDYLLTSLRTIWGIDVEYIRMTFGEGVADKVVMTAKKYVSTGQMEINDKLLRIKSDFFLLSDGIIADFIIV